MSYTDFLTGQTIYASNTSIRTINFDVDITFNWPSTSSNTLNPLAYTMELIPSIDNLNVFMPDATEGSSGIITTFKNSSGYDLNIKDKSGNLIITIESSFAYQIILKNNSTSNGSWLVFPFASGTAAVTEITFNEPETGFTISGSPAVSGDNIITFELSDTLESLENLGSVSVDLGIIVKSASKTLVARSIVTTENTNIIIENGDGVSDNPTIKLNTELTEIVSADIGNLNFIQNIISTSEEEPIRLESSSGVSVLNSINMGLFVDSEYVKNSGFYVDSECLDNAKYRMPTKEINIEYFLDEVLGIYFIGENEYGLEPSGYSTKGVSSSWCIFNATLEPYIVLEQLGIFSIIKNGAGDFSVTLSKPMDSINYGVHFYAKTDTTNANYTITIVDESHFNITTSVDGTPTNMTYNFFTVFGTFAA